jgi:hypothetical protein
METNIGTVRSAEINGMSGITMQEGNQDERLERTGNY